MTAAPSRRSPGAPQGATLGTVLGALLAAAAPRWTSAEVFTTNAVCLKNRCINPVFPGVEDLHRLDGASWFCSSLRSVAKSTSFCRRALDYDPALPVIGDVTDRDALVRKQDAAAMTMFHYHLAGMGLEAWDYQNPEEANDCVQSVWRMACYTYFPRAKVGCQEGMSTNYVRPCQSSCQNYVRSCAVECCDESVKCVFTHRKQLSDGVALVLKGYEPHDGPSSMCTGAAEWSRSPGLWALLLPVLALLSSGPEGTPNVQASTRQPRAAQRGRRPRGAPGGAPGGGAVALAASALVLGLAVLLQGCDTDVPTHLVGHWRAEPDYLIRYEFVPPGASARSALLNSCSMGELAQTMQCSGRGVCRLWDEDSLDSTVSFCQCDRDWADPECGTRRKSQAVAFLLSVFLGPFGADLFYLGFPVAGGAKLASLGGLGVWWLYDVVRVGCAPVSAQSFRVSSDLSHWVFVLVTVSLALTVGFLVSSFAVAQNVGNKRKEAIRLQAEESNAIVGKMSAKQRGNGGAQRAPATSVDYGSMGLGGGQFGEAFPAPPPLPPAPHARQPTPWAHERL